MPPMLTEQQLRALRDANDVGPVSLIDPDTNAEYILVRADVFREMQEWTNDMDPREAYPLVDRIMAEDDAQDPLLAGYDWRTR